MRTLEVWPCDECLWKHCQVWKAATPVAWEGEEQPVRSCRPVSSHPSITSLGRSKKLFRARFGSTYTKIGTIQRRLAWPLRKDDTQIREAFHIFKENNREKKKKLFHPASWSKSASVDLWAVCVPLLTLNLRLFHLKKYHLWQES